MYIYIYIYMVPPPYIYIYIYHTIYSLKPWLVQGSRALEGPEAKEPPGLTFARSRVLGLGL